MSVIHTHERVRLVRIIQRSRRSTCLRPHRQSQQESEQQENCVPRTLHGCRKTVETSPIYLRLGVLMPRILSRSLRKFAFQLAHELWITLEFLHQQSHDLQGLPADVMFHSLDILVHGFGIEPKP